jgi:SAM-dependent methyltransferase
MYEDGTVTAHHPADERWLAAMWPFVREHLPAAPGRVLELGCGPLGGFVPRMSALGHDSIGVDPVAPDEPGYDRTEFEHHEITEPLDALVACTSLHHVADLRVVLDRIASVLVPGGTLVIVEWAHERFDEATARWCFGRLAADDGGWLRQHRDRWQESGQPWAPYFQQWVSEEQLHTGQDILAAAAPRFATAAVQLGPFLFADLDIDTAEEQSAIDAGLIQPTGLRFVGAARTPGHVGAVVGPG